MMKKKRSLSILLILALAITTAWLTAKISGCCSTPKDFQNQTTAPVEPADFLAGSWEGTWKSNSKPIGGKLAAMEFLRDRRSRQSKAPSGRYRANESKCLRLAS